MRPAFRALPAELTMLNDLSVFTEPWRKKRPLGFTGDASRHADPDAYFLYFMDDGTWGREVWGGRPGFWLRGDGSCEDRDHRTEGRLKVFFGASPGVGKTYAMLTAARAKRAEGVDVVIGWVETHGRAETAALLEGLERLPPREVEYRGVTLREFDLDAALARKPALLLLDELAHTNAPGARHAKRWQDVEGAARCRRQRLHHAQRPASREPERPRQPGQRHRRAGDPRRRRAREARPRP